MKGLLMFILFPIIGEVASQWVKEMENPDLFQGDMVLTPEQRASWTNPNAYGSVVRAKRLPSEYIHYGMAPEIESNPKAVEGIKKALQTFQTYTCLRFFYTKSKPIGIRNWWLYFYKGKGCNAPVGFQGLQARHDISIGSGCEYHVTIMHEVMHVLGFFHEHSRPDRDNYVIIHKSEIQPEALHHFEKMSDQVIDSRGSPYDYRSIMHYAWSAWAKYDNMRRITIETKDPLDKYEIGQRVQMSYQDQVQIIKMFNCVTWEKPFPTVAPEKYVRPPQSCRNTYFDCDLKANFLKLCWTWGMRHFCQRSCRFCDDGSTKNVVQGRKKRSVMEKIKNIAHKQSLKTM